MKNSCRFSRRHHLEQLVRGSFERIASLYVVEEDWARQKQRTLLRQQNRRNGIDGTGGLPERDHQSLRVVSGAVINVNVVEACGRMAQAYLTRPGLTDIDRCPVQNLGSARLPNLDRMRHTDFRKNMNFLISSCKTENSTTSLLSRL